MILILCTISMTFQKVQIFALGIIAGCPTALEISYFFALILLFLLLFQNSHVMYLYDSSCYILLSNSGTNGYTLVCRVEVQKRVERKKGKLQCLNELLETQKLDEFKHSNFKLDQTQARSFVFKANSNSIKLEILQILGPKLGKLASKLELKLEK